VTAPRLEEGSDKGLSVADVLNGLTKAQRRCIVNASIGYNDDATLDPSGRRMFYRLIDKGLLEHVSGMEPPDIGLTPLGKEVRAALLREASSKAREGEGR